MLRLRSLKAPRIGLGRLFDIIYERKVAQNKHENIPPILLTVLIRRG